MQSLASDIVTDVNGRKQLNTILDTELRVTMDLLPGATEPGYIPKEYTATQLERVMKSLKGHQYLVTIIRL